MSIVLLDDVETGMTLANDVADRQGRVLLKAGVSLNAKHIRTLQTWGVLEVDIEGVQEKNDPSESFPDEWLVEADALARDHFQHCRLNHPLIETLFEHWKLHYLQQRKA